MQLKRRRRPHLRLHRACAEVLEPRTLLSAALVTDVNVQPLGSDPYAFTDVQGKLFFTATDGDHGTELWVSDGTRAGTRMVKDIRPGVDGSGVTEIKDFNGIAYFAADDGSRGTELWRSDGTDAGTYIVRDITVGSAPSYVTDLTVYAGALWFAAADASHGTELWTTDGTAAGTQMKDLLPGSASSWPDSFVAAGDRLYFSAYDSSAGRELWRVTAGSLASATRFVDIVPGSTGSGPSPFAAVGSTVYFTATTAANGTEIWATDGTAAGTALIKDINPGTASSRSLPGPFTHAVIGSTLLFTATDAAHGTEVWRTDGVGTGASLVADISPGTSSPYVTSLVAFNGRAYFVATGSTIRPQLWTTDGTAAGTAMITDPATMPATSSVIVSGGSLYFIGGYHYLWKSDGTPDGTAPIRTFESISAWTGLVPSGGKIYLYASDDPNATVNDLWRTDGTDAGTFALGPLNTAGTESSSPTNLTATTKLLFYVANDGVHGRELWRTDGTPAGTFMVRDLVTGPDSASISQIVAVGNKVYFGATDDSGLSGLWESDGTGLGTRLIGYGLTSGVTGSRIAYNGTLFFTATDMNALGGPSSAFWKLEDGVPTVITYTPGSTGSYLTVAGGKLFFVASNGYQGSELWRSNGTPSGTYVVKDIRPGSNGSFPADLSDAAGILYFTASDGTNGTELWRSDGTSAGTYLVKDITAGTGSTTIYDITGVGGRIFFQASGTLWTSNGTAAGTVMIPTTASHPGAFVALNGVAYFRAAPGGGGDQLWRSDGTAAGTVPVSPQTSGSMYDVTSVNGYVYVTANGSDVWRIDGLSDSVVEIFHPQSDFNLFPEDFTYANGLLFFTFSDPVKGNELYAFYPPTAEAGGPYVVETGHDVVLDGSATTNPGGGAMTLTWDLDGDGIFGETGAAASRGDETGARPTYHARAFQGTYTVTLKARDNVTGFSSSRPVDILVVPPPQGYLSDTSVSEGNDATVAFEWVYGNGPLTFSYDFDNDGSFEVTSSASETVTVPRSYLPDGPAPHTVRAAIRDAYGLTTDFTATISVTNVAPTAEMAGATGAEGSTATLSFVGATDASQADVAAGFLYSFDFGDDGTFEVVDSASPSASVFLPDSGSLPVRGRVTDRDGGYTEYVATVTVLNVAPTAVLSGDTGEEGWPVWIGFSAQADVQDDLQGALTYSYDFDNDGTWDIVDTYVSRPWHIFDDNGTHTVRGRVKDKDGGYTDYTTLVTIANVAPEAGFTAGGVAVLEGSSATVRFVAASDRSEADTAAGFRYSFDFDNDGTFEIVDSANPVATVPVRFLDGPSIRTVRGRVTDKDGGFADRTDTIQVINLSPTIVIPAAANGSVVLGNDFLLSLSALDPGDDKVTNWHIDWGDGRSSDIAKASGLFPHTYGAAGTYAIKVTATDEDGSYSASTHALVSATPPTATFAAGSLAPDGSAYRFTVAYADDLGIDATSLGDGDFHVTGPAGTAQARLVSYVPATDGHGGVATYDVPSPLGTWAWQDNGTYTVSARAGEVRDLQGIDLPAGTVGAFAVDLIPPTAPDLFPQFSGTLPKTLTPGAKYSVAVKVSNRGTKNMATTNVTTRLLLSADPVADAGDLVLGSAVRTLGLRFNASTAVTVAFPSPKLSAGGKYYLLAVTDATNAVAERDERNNVAASVGVTVPALTVDLATTFSTKPKSTYQPGNPIGFGLRVANAGNVDASGPATLRLYFSTDSILDDGDMLAATSVLPLKLKAKASAVFNRTIKVPAPLAGKKWYLLAAVDGTAVGDHSPSNNIARSGPFAVASRA